MQAALGAAFAALVAAFAHRARALTLGGAIAAFPIGAVVFGSGGWPAAAVLFAFFIPATLLTRIGRRRKAAATGGHEGPRSGFQVLANGGVAAFCALAATQGNTFWSAAFAGAFAAAAADTWGTEIGTLSPRPPVSILTLRPLRAGTSGGITALGLAATVAGAVVVAAVAAKAGLAPLGAVAAGGIAGALADSVLGASLQALRWCPACACECETRRHDCGTATVLRRGATWLGNDGVNLAATFAGATIAGIASNL
jgi:uncharacterized protein (TIGR00297 family)